MRVTRCHRLSLNGAGGIRTPGAFRHNGFQDRRLKPLGHCSKMLQVGSVYSPHRDHLDLGTAPHTVPVAESEMGRTTSRRTDRHCTRVRPGLQGDRDKFVAVAGFNCRSPRRGGASTRGARSTAKSNIVRRSELSGDRLKPAKRPPESGELDRVTGDAERALTNG